MGIISAITELSPDTQKKCQAFLDKCKEQNLDVVLNETRREYTTQMVYYLQGRLDIGTNPNVVNELNDLRRIYGFWNLSPWEATKKQITWTLKSKHLTGEAFDAVPQKGGKPWWNAPMEVWEQMGVIGESVGLKWGGRWKNKDSPHFEEP